MNMHDMQIGAVLPGANFPSNLDMLLLLQHLHTRAYTHTCPHSVFIYLSIDESIYRYLSIVQFCLTWLPRSGVLLKE